MCSGTLTIVLALLWVFLFYVCIFTLGSLKLHSVFQMWCHSMDRNNHFSQPAGYSFAIAAHYAVGLLCCKVTADLLVSHQDSQISVSKSFPIALASSS